MTAQNPTRLDLVFGERVGELLVSTELARMQTQTPEGCAAIDARGRDRRSTVGTNQRHGCILAIYRVEPGAGDPGGSVCAVFVYDHHQTMPTKTDDLTTIAVFTTSQAGQFALLETREERVLRSLAHAWKLDPETANRLVRSGTPGAAERALRGVDDLDLFKVRSAKNALGLEWSRRNPCAPEALLESGLRAHSEEALCNPSTPEELRKKYLNVRSVEIFAAKSGSTTYRVVRNHEIALTNQWALECAGAPWPVEFRRGLSALPGATSEDLEALAAGRIRFARPQAHPARNNLMCGGATIEALLELNHPAGDIAALETGRLGTQHLPRLVRYDSHDDMDLVAPTLPHVIGRVFNAFGPAYVRALDALQHDHKNYYRWPISGTRAKAAAWVAPGLAYLDTYSPWVLEGIETAEEILGGCEESWRTLIELVRRRGENPMPMARMAGAARRLIHGA